MSLVEDTLQWQRGVWTQIAERALRFSGRDLPSRHPSRILMYGLGSSHYAARLAAAALVRDPLRARIPVISCSSMAIGREILPRQGDWVFAFSHRGGSQATRDAMKACRDAGVFQLLICGQGAESSPDADVQFETVALEQVEPHTVSVTSAICAATTLIGGNRFFEAWKTLGKDPNPDLSQMRERAGSGPDVLLGEWEGQWIAREGGLKLMEMACLPVRIFGTEEFFHGPRFSARDASIWHVATPQDARTEELHPRVRVVVERDRPLAWVNALVEMQWLALAVALNRDVNPDRQSSDVPPV